METGTIGGTSLLTMIEPYLHDPELGQTSQLVVDKCMILEGNLMTFKAPNPLFIEPATLFRIDPSTTVGQFLLDMKTTETLNLTAECLKYGARPWSHHLPLVETMSQRIKHL
jgi:hypothetical protein